MVKILVSGAAGHYPYLLGVARGLQLDNDYFSHANNDSEIHAYSSGCVVALLLALNIDINLAMNCLQINILKDLNNTLLGSGFNFLIILKTRLLKFLNSFGEDIYLKANNKLFIYISYFKNWGLSSEIISDFYNNEDLVDCCIASGFIPLYGRSILFPFRDKYCIDYAINFKPPEFIDINIKRNAVRDLNKIFGLYIFITSDYDKVKDMYQLGIEDYKTNKNSFMVNFIN